MQPLRPLACMLTVPFSHSLVQLRTLALRAIAPGRRYVFYGSRRQVPSDSEGAWHPCGVGNWTFSHAINCPIFRGRREGDRLIGVVLVHTAVESWQNGTLCSTPAGEYPINGIVSGDGQLIDRKSVV